MTDRTQSGFYNKSSISGRVSLNKLTQARVAITCPGPGSRHPWWWFSFRTGVRLVCLRRTVRPITQCDEFTATRTRTYRFKHANQNVWPITSFCSSFWGDVQSGSPKELLRFLFLYRGQSTNRRQSMNVRQTAICAKTCKLYGYTEVEEYRCGGGSSLKNLVYL